MTDSGQISEFEPEEAKTKAIKSVKWSFLGTVLPQLIHPIITITLARLLMPEDYGLFGISSVVIGFITSFQGLTMGYVLTRHELKNLKEAANVTFWVGAIGGVFFFFVIQLLAPVIADFFDEPRALFVLRVQAFAILPVSFVPEQQAMLTRSYAFSKLFLRRVVPMLIPFLVAIPLAIKGFGYWALVFNVIVGNFASALTLWLASSWRPQFQFDLKVAFPMLKIAVWIMLERLLDWSLITIDRAWIGKIFGVRELGIYNLSKSISTTILSAIIITISSIAYVYLSGVRNDLKQFQNSYLRLIQYSATLVFPVSIGIMAVAPELVHIAFGDKWLDSIRPLQMLIMGDALWYLFYYNADAFRALARANLTVIVRIFMLLCLFISFFILAKYGFNYFCAGVFISALLVLPLQFYLALKVTGVAAKKLLITILKPLISSIIMGASVFMVNFLLKSLGISEVVRLPAQIAVGIIVYTALLWMIDRDGFKILFLIGVKALKITRK